MCLNAVKNIINRRSDASAVGFLQILGIYLSALKVGFSVLFSDLTDDFAGISVGDHVCGNVLCDHTARADDAVISDGNARQNDHAGSQPAVASNVNGGVKLIRLFPKLGQDGMPCGGKGNVGANMV